MKRIPGVSLGQSDRYIDCRTSCIASQLKSVLSQLRSVEYCRMHDSDFIARGWELVLQEVFVGEPREMEINVVWELLRAIGNTLG